jgi:hypothetical protein
MSGSNHLIVSIPWHRTISVWPYSYPMEMAHSFSSIQQISCHIIALLCSDRRPAYFLMRQGPASCALRFIIKDQCPVQFLSHSHYQGPTSCSICYSSRQLSGLVICDISVSGPATELIPSPSDSKLLFAFVPIYLYTSWTYNNAITLAAHIKYIQI